jgi:hypothetical protein
MPEGTQLFFPVINGIGINAPDVRGQDKKYLTVSQVHVDAAPKLLGQLIYQWHLMARQWRTSNAPVRLRALRYGHGFLLSKDKFIIIDVPAAFGIGAQGLAINPEGDILGLYFDGSGNTHGFLLSK